jgi:hypothetical protein
LSKNLNTKGQKVQDKAIELNTTFGAEGTKARAKDIAFSIPMPFVKENNGKVDIQKLVIDVNFEERVEGDTYLKSVSLNDAEAEMVKLVDHMQDICTGGGRDKRHTSQFEVNINGTTLIVKATERDAKDTDAPKLMELSRWVTRDKAEITSHDEKIPSYMYLLNRPSVIFRCKGATVEMSARAAAAQILDYIDNDLIIDNVFDELKEKVKTNMQIMCEKKNKEANEIIEALNREIKRAQDELAKQIALEEKEQLEREIGWVKTEVIKCAERYEALTHRLTDKVDLINAVKSKGIEVMVKLQGALVAGNKDLAIEIAFGVEQKELAHLKTCMNNKDNLKWMRDNKSLFTNPEE